jgi:sporulation protein YlmC with PRC-barrel domain
MVLGSDSVKHARAETQQLELAVAGLSQLDDKVVSTLNGQELGSVRDVVIRHSDHQLGLVVAVGGFLGIGATDVFVPVNELDLQGENVLWQTRQPADQIIYFSDYDSSQYATITERFETLGEARQALMSAQAS